jgi:hypothetical protein
MAAARRPNKLVFATANERLAHRRARAARNMRLWYTPQRRRRKYQNTGH